MIDQGGVVIENDQGAVVVWHDKDGLHSQPFQLVDEAEKFATTCEPWAVVVMGGAGEFVGSVSVHGEYPFPAFGGEV